MIWKKISLLLIFILVFVECVSCGFKTEGHVNVLESKENEETNEPTKSKKKKKTKTCINDYFVSEDVIKYRGILTFNDDRNEKEIIVDCKLIDQSEYGELYHLMMRKTKDVLISKEDRDFGFFYVTKDKIYHFYDLTENQQNFLIIKGELPDNSIVVCQTKSFKDNNIGKKGIHKSIVVEDDIIKYSYYEDWGNTNYYETIIWKEKKGIIMLKRGYGALRDTVVLWKEEYINPYDFL